MTAWAQIDPDPKGPYLAIGCSVEENHLAQQIPGCNYSKHDHIWRAPLSWPAWVAFCEIWKIQPIQVYPELAAYGARQAAIVDEMYEDRGRIDAEPEWQWELERVEMANGSPRVDPWQRGAAAWLAKWFRVGLEDPTGNGKTPCVARALQLLHQKHEGDISPALVICPGSALFPWRDKLAEWAPELSVRVVRGTALQRSRALLSSDLADVYLIAWPNLRYHTRLAPYPGQSLVRCPEHGGLDPKITPGRCEVHEKDMNEMPWSVIIPDEAHRMRNAKSKWTRAVWHLAGQAPYFWPLTGTLVADKATDPWPIHHAMSPQAYPSKSRFTDLWAVKVNAWHGGTEVLGIRPETEASYHAVIQPYWRRIPKEIARPDRLEPYPPEFRYTEMVTGQLAPYRQIKRALLAEIEGQTIMPANAMVKFTRLCQLAASSIELSDGEDQFGFTTQQVNLSLPSGKLDDFLEFLGDTDEQVVAVANSPRFIALAEHKLALAKITHTKIVGGMDDPAKYAANMAFQNGEVRVIFLTAGAGGESIDLQSASTLAWLQPNPSTLVHDQVMGRVDRRGQLYRVREIYFITPGTVEERLYALMCEKQERANSVSRDVDLLRWIVQGEDQ